MTRIALWFVSTVTAVVLLFGYRTSTSNSTVASTPPVSSIAPPSATPSASRSTTTASSPTASAATPSVPVSIPRTLVGAVSQTRWGPVQVQITVTDHTITRVDVLRYPTGNNKDIKIARRSLPILINETLQAQSARIDMVSGATYTSAGYIGSLQSALDQGQL